MPLTTWNPGEPVFDQATGEPLILADGSLVEVVPGLKVEAPDGRTIDGDDVANAAYYRANKYEGETMRDRSVGVPYLRLGLGQGDAGLATSIVVAEVRTRTPGVAGVVAVRVHGLDPATRVLQWSATLLRAGGGEQSIVTTTGG